MPSQEQSGNRTSHGIVNQEFEKKIPSQFFMLPHPLWVNLLFYFSKVVTDYTLYNGLAGTLEDTNLISFKLTLLPSKRVFPSFQSSPIIFEDEYFHS